MSTLRRLFVTRRGLGLGLAGAAVAAGLPVAAVAPDPGLRDAALRGLALAGQRGDGVSIAQAAATLARMAESDPEAALLVQIYRWFDVRPASYWRDDAPLADGNDLVILHAAIDQCRPVVFGYTDLSGQDSHRSVLPLAIVHPPQGVKLLAFCQERQDFRQFFVRSLQDLQPQAGDFTAQRLTLLSALVDKECDPGGGNAALIW